MESSAYVDKKYSPQILCVIYLISIVCLLEIPQETILTVCNSMPGKQMMLVSHIWVFLLFGFVLLVIA